MKLGDTPFICNNVAIDMDSSVFVSLREFNEIRRLLVEELIHFRQNNKKEFLQKSVSFDSLPSNENCDCLISCFVRNEEQLKKCLELGIKRIYVDQLSLYKKYCDSVEIYYQVPRCVFSTSKEYQERNLVSDYSYYPSCSIGNYSLNVSNSYTAYYLQKLGIEVVGLSVELTEEEIRTFLQHYSSKFGETFFEVMVYGRVENMIIKGNILHLEENHYYNLTDSKNRKFPVYFDGRLTHVLNWEDKNMNIFHNHSNLTMRFDFLFESPSEIEKIITRFQVQKEK
jgi:putative protease